MSASSELQEGDDATAASSEIREMKNKVTFLKDCWETYAAKKATESEEHASDDFLSSTSLMPTASFSDYFHFVMPQELVVHTRHMDVVDMDISSPLADTLTSNEPFFKFHEVFYQLLEENYGHLSETVLFGDPEQEEQRVILFDAFKRLETCASVKDFEMFFKKQFSSPAQSELVKELQQSITDLYNDEGFNSPGQLYRMILDEIMTYCFYVIDLRIQTTQVFEEFERELHERTTSYEFLTSGVSGLNKNKLSQLECGLHSLDLEYVDCAGAKPSSSEWQVKRKRRRKGRRIVKEVYDLNHEAFTQDKRCLYERQVKLFEHALSVLEILELKNTNQVKQLLSSGKNHYSYLHEHIHRLQSLLSSLLEPYRISCKTAHDSHIFTIQMTAGTITGALSKLNDVLSNSSQQIKEGDEIHLCADTIIYGDQDINLQGVSVVVIAPTIVNCKKDERICIKTDGKQLDNLREPGANPAECGIMGTESNIDGTPGSDGEDGRYGNAGGHILLVSNDLKREDFDLSANGSPGECGQDGGDGGDGWTPTRKGEDGKKLKFHKNWILTVLPSVVISYGTFGEDGGRGGDAGMGGAPGKSGISGKIELFNLRDVDCEEYRIPIDDGEPGSPGTPGKAGKHTRHGIDKGGYAKGGGFGATFLSLFNVDGREKDYTAGQLTHPLIDPFGRPGSGKQIECVNLSASLPRQIKGMDHPMFSDRGSNLPGKSTTSRVNTALANENKAINKQALLHSLHQQFQLSLQHWNVKSHNQFLSAFAERLGEAYHDNTFVALTHSEKLKANSAAWISTIQRLAKATKSTTVQQTRRAVKTQTQVMKDFAEESKYTRVSYLDSTPSCQASPSLDLSPLIQVARVDEFKQHLKNIKLETLLFSSEFDEMVELLPSQFGLSSDNIVIVYCQPSYSKEYRLNHKFLIMKDMKGNFLYVHQNYVKLSIRDADIIERLNSLTLQENEPVAIDWDDVLYVQIVKMIHGHLGHDVTVPFTLSQLLCSRKLELIVSMRKTYHAIAGKYVNSFKKCQAFRKLYSQYFDEVLLCNSLEALSTLMQDLLDNHLLLLPLDLSWITTQSLHEEDSKDLSMSVAAYNHHPTFIGMLVVIRSLHDYHQANISQTKNRLAYLSHLSTDACLSGLNKFYDQFCTALKVFCDEHQIDSDVQSVPSQASSEILFIHIVPPLTECKQNQQDFHQIMTTLFKKQPLVFTVVDSFLNKFVHFAETLFNIQLPRRETLLHPADDFSFDERYAVFQALPSVQAALSATLVYPKQIRIRKSMNQKLQKLLEYVYDILHSCLKTFNPETAVDELVYALNRTELKPDETCEALERLAHNVDRYGQLPLFSLIHLLKQVQSLIAWKSTQAENTPVSEIEIDLKYLLTQVPECFKGLQLFLEKLGSFTIDRNERDQTLVTYTSIIAAIYNVLHRYPMAVSRLTLQEWMKCLKNIMTLVERKYLDYNATDTIVEKLTHLKTVLQRSILGFESLSSLCCELKVTRYISTLNQYSTFFHSKDHRTKANLLIQSNLGLEKQFYSTPCVDTFSKWLHLGLMEQGRPQHVTVVTERLKPSYDVRIQNHKPNEDTVVDMPTVFLFPNHDQWRLCTLDHSHHNPNSYTFHYKDISDDVITTVLDENVLQNVHVHEEADIQLSEEQKARILSVLNYEQDEYMVQHKVSLHGQTLIDEINIQFSLVTISTVTSQVLIHKNPTDVNDLKRQIDDNDILIVQCRLDTETKSALRALGISHDLFTTQDLPAVCIVKYPGQQAVVQSVFRCGDKVEHDFSYILPMIINHLHLNGDKPLFEQLQPLADLLNQYYHFYQSLLPIDYLNIALQASLKSWSKIVFHANIPQLVMVVRRHFIQECLKIPCDIDLSNIQNSIIDMLKPSMECPIQTHMFLTGLESFVYFYLVKTKESNFSWFLQRQKKEAENVHYQLWNSVLLEATMLREEFKCVCLAFAFLDSPQFVDVFLHKQTASFRFQMYQSISNGLMHLESCAMHGEVKDTEHDVITIIKQLHKLISNYQEHHNIEALYEASMEIEDEKNLDSLLELFQSIAVLKQYLFHSLRGKHLLDQESCFRLLKQLDFFDELYDKVLAWCMKQQHSFLAKFQSIVSDSIFSQSTGKEEFVSTVCNWLIERTEIALSRYDWKELQLVHLIVEMVMHSMISEVDAVHHRKKRPNDTNLKEPSDLLLKWLTIVQVFDASLDVSSIATVMTSVSSDQWLKYLLIQNLLLLCAEEFGVHSTDYIQEQLLNVDAQLIQILYNVFIVDQYNRDDDTENSSHSKISASQFHGILDWLPFIEPVPDACSTLYKTALSMWDKELAEVHFKQYVDQWQGLSDADRKRTTYLLNRVRLNERKRVSHLEFMSLLSMIRDQYIISASENNKPLLVLVDHLYYKRITLDQAKVVVTSHQYDEWCEQFNSLITGGPESHEPRSMEEVLHLIRKQVQSGSYEMSMDEFELLEKEALQISKQVKEVAKRQKNGVTEKKTKKFFETLQRQATFAKKQQWLTRNHVKFVYHILVAWMMVAARSRETIDPYNTQIISLLLFLHSEEQGLLQQMKTGEGKTAVVGLLAAAKALLGFKVDIVTSNRDLAREGLKKCEGLFAFLNLQGAVNCTDDDDTNQQAYKSHIVYGDVGSFQRDVLSEEMETGIASFTSRYSDEQKYCLLVDEVDSMFLDKGRHMLYISRESAALKHLETLFMMIWSSVLSIDTESENDEVTIDFKLNQMTEDLKTLIRNKTISVPDYLTDFCNRKMKSWVYSAYQARFMEVDDQFIIDHKSSDDDERDESAKQIFPMDKPTGIEEYNMKWTNGLSQFLELKYRRSLSTESLKAVYISNMRFFKRYGKALYGMTGTLGSFASRHLLQEVYSIITVNIPTNKPKRYTRQKSRVACSDGEWCEEMYKEICERNTEQPVLVICESIKRLKDLQSYLESKGRTDIIHYARDGDDVENTLNKEQGGASRGQLILATNKGGRGTDIKIKKKDRHKGLHVIVSFLPENTRIEEQAFGRAARAGQPGSGCLVLQIDASEYKDKIEVFGTVTAATETLIEIEKIRRDQSESDRIAMLLSEGIPQLDLEENLYKSFHHFRKTEFESSLNTAELLGVEVESSKELKKMCVSIVTDQWAYWLDSVSDKIRVADSAKTRQAIMDDFHESFLAPRLNAPISYPDCFLFSTPEHCISLGQALIKEKQFEAAQTCFDLAMDKGDKTGVAAMAACYCFCKIKRNSKPSSENKKKCRRYLKVAKSKLDTLRQSWMSNGEIGKALGDLVDVSQYVEDEENHYTRQVEEKLKVIGLHLNTLETLLGSGLDESAFVKESKLEVERLTPDDSKRVYHKLVDCGIICHFKVRSCWKSRKKLELLIRNEVEPRIAEGLIGCITKNENVTEEHMNEFVYSSDKLWDILMPLMEETKAVKVLEVSQVKDKKLTDDNLKQLWEKLQHSFSAQLRGSPSKLALTLEDELFKQLQTKEYEPLTSHLKGNALYYESYRGMMKSDVSERIQTLDLQKYEECKIKSEDGASEQTLREFLIKMFKFCQENEQGYCYEHMLPFDRQTFEAKKLHGFLLQHDILKSGSLVWREDYTDDDKLESAVKKALGKKDYHKDQLKFIVNRVQGLRGDVHGFERKMKVGFVDFYELEDHPEDVPQTLDFFTSWHLDYFLTLKQADKGWWDWNAFAVAMLGLAQVVAGVVLVTLTVGAGSTIGSALISEGINDMVYATIAGITGTFSWKEWAIQKAISVAISIATAGIGALAAPAKLAVKVGSAARYSTFAKTLAKTAGEFVVNAAAGIVTDVLLADVQERVVATIVEGIEKKLFSQITEDLRVQLVKIATHKASDDEFHEHCQKIVQELQSTLNLNNSTVADAFDQLGSAIASSISKNSKAIANSLSKSKSVWAKMASVGMKAASMAEMIYSAIHTGVSLGHAVSAMVKLADIKSTGEAVRSESDVDETIIQRELDEIKQCFKQFAQKQLQQKLKGVLQSSIKRSMNSVARAGKKTVSAQFKQTFNKTGSEMVRDLRDKNKKITLVSDHDDNSHLGASKKQKPPKPMTDTEKKDQLFQEKREKLQGSIAKPHRKVLSENERMKVKQTLQHTEYVLPATHEHHPDKLATGYSRDRGPELERMPQRERAKSQLQEHLGLPQNSASESNKTRPRANTNCVQTKTHETKPSKATEISNVASDLNTSAKKHNGDQHGENVIRQDHGGGGTSRDASTRVKHHDRDGPGEDHSGRGTHDSNASANREAVTRQDHSGGTSHDPGTSVKDDRDNHGEDHSGRSTHDPNTSANREGSVTRQDHSGGTLHDPGISVKDDRDKHGGSGDGQDHSGRGTHDDKATVNKQSGSKQDKHSSQEMDDYKEVTRELLRKHENDTRIPKKHDCHPDNLAWGLPSERKELEMKYQRPRADTELHYPTHPDLERRPRVHSNAARVNQSKTNAAARRRKVECKIYVYAEVDQHGRRTGLYKIGKTKQDITKRMGDVNAGNPRQRWLVALFNVSSNTEKEMKRSEDAVKRVLADANTKKKWEHGGGTEWYEILDRDYKRAICNIRTAVKNPDTKIKFQPSKTWLSFSMALKYDGLMNWGQNPFKQVTTTT